MRHLSLVVVGLSLAVFALAVPVGAEDAKPEPAEKEKPAAAGAEVTLVGLALNNGHLYEKEKYVFFQAFDGTPEIKAEFEKIMAEYYPDKGLDADAARQLQDQIMTRLKYYADGPLLDELHKVVSYSAPIMALTGVISEKDGKKWITVSTYEKIYWHIWTKKFPHGPYPYPAKMLAPDKPFVMPDKEPLVLKINDTLSLKCIYVPPGRFFMGEPLYQAIHGSAGEDSPHMVTLTRGYYMAEHPITQEMFESVTGYDPSKRKEAKAPVNSSCADTYKFCELLSAKTGRKVRIPTAAEWDYAARSGTSNPTFPEKYAAQTSGNRFKNPTPVKSAQPNAWGFYDIICNDGYERVSDRDHAIDRKDTVDPVHIPPQDEAEATRGNKHGHQGKGCTFWIGNMEFIGEGPGPETTYPGVIRFRIVVEAEK